MALTYLSIEPVKGNPALLPNQPILQGCKVYNSQLVAGDIVKLVSVDDGIVVDKATYADLPFGIVVNSEVKGGWNKNERVSIFTLGAYVYLYSTSTDIEAGSKVGFTADEIVDVVETTGNGVIGIACCKPKNGLFVVQVKPELYYEVTEINTKQANLNLGDGLEWVDTDMYAWDGDITGKETVYTKAETPEATGNKVYYLTNGKYEILVDDATYADDKLTIALSGHSYDYERNDDEDTQSAFLNTVSE